MAYWYHVQGWAEVSDRFRAGITGLWVIWQTFSLDQKFSMTLKIAKNSFLFNVSTIGLHHGLQLLVIIFTTCTYHLRIKIIPFFDKTALQAIQISVRFFFDTSLNENQGRFLTTWGHCCPNYHRGWLLSIVMHPLINWNILNSHTKWQCLCAIMASFKAWLWKKFDIFLKAV